MSLFDPRLRSEDKVKKEDDSDTPSRLHDVEVKPPHTPDMDSEGSGASGGRTAARGSSNPYSYYIKGRVVLVTGISPGSLGAAFLKAIAGSGPADVILAGRDREKVQATAQMVADLNPSIRIRLLQLDLLSLDAVRRAAGRIMEWADLAHIDILVSSAGIMATDWALSTDGFESQLATNHLGPFLFINLIMSKILKSKAPRVVLVGSGCHRLSQFRFGDYNFQGGETYNKWQAYGQSKTANSLMALSLATKLGVSQNLMAFSLHPGVITTNIGSHLNWEEELPQRQEVDRFLGNPEGWADTVCAKTIDEGVAMYLYAAFDPYIWHHNGAYLDSMRVGNHWRDTIKPWATSAAEAERLWNLSEQLVGETFAYKECGRDL